MIHHNICIRNPGNRRSSGDPFADGEGQDYNFCYIILIDGFYCREASGTPRAAHDRFVIYNTRTTVSRPFDNYPGVRFKLKFKM